MTQFGIDFDYKGEGRRAWLFCATITLINLPLLAVSFHTYTYFMVDYSVVNIVLYVISTFHQNIMLTAPSLTYVFWLRNLQKRYAALNQLLM